MSLPSQPTSSLLREGKGSGIEVHHLSPLIFIRGSPPATPSQLSYLQGSLSALVVVTGSGLTGGPGTEPLKKCLYRNEKFGLIKRKHIDAKKTWIMWFIEF